MRRMARPGVSLVIAVALVALALGSCSAVKSKSQQSPIASTKVAPAPIALESFCEVPMPDSWKLTIASGKIAGEGTWSRVVALDPNGDKTVKEIRKGSSNYLELTSSSGELQTIAKIAHTDAGGYLETADFDGRWVVYSLGYGQSIANRWAIYAWDSHSAEPPQKVASWRPNSRMTLDPELHLHQGKATWIAGSAIKDALEVHLFDLATKNDLIVETGAIYGHPFFAKNLLVWPESNGSGRPLKMNAYDIATSTRVNLPATLNTIQKVGSIVGDSSTWAWVGGSTFSEVWVWRTGWSSSRKIFDSGKGSWVSSVQLAGDIVTWTSDATYAANLDTGSYVKLTPDYGSSMAKGSFLEFSYATTNIKSQYMPQDSFVVDVRKLAPLPTCATSK
jgi:hypothetical protein